MAVFEYKARNLKGEYLEGIFETASYEALEYMLREKGFFVVQAKEKPKEFSLGAMLGKTGVKDLAVFCRQFAVILQAGIRITEAVGILRDQSGKKKMRDTLSVVYDELQKGKVLSQGLAQFPDVFPEFMSNMVKVGEASGSLDIVLNRLAEYYEKESKVVRKVKTATTYPAILAVLTIGVVLLLILKILPMFSDMLSSMGAELPLITRIIMGVSKFMLNNFFAIALTAVSAFAGFRYYIKTDKGRLWFDTLKLEMPAVKKPVRKIITSRFARSLGILLKSGIPVINSMEIMKNLIGNKAVEKKFEECIDEIKEGKGIALPVEKLGIFPPLLIHMIAVGESTGELDEMLSRTADFFDEEVEEAVERLTALLEPAMIVIMAAVVGTIIISIMLPMISILGNVQ